ncbi:MAG: hypothetical protein PHT15_09740 [Gallionellaceae bacterium]|nr:hypothetical protein [Gallionellaceae bacterium]
MAVKQIQGCWLCTLARRCVPWTSFVRIVARYGGDSGVQSQNGDSRQQWG